MIEILKSKNASTRFQILIEIAALGPAVHQRTIATRLGITPQAVSDYFQQMQQEDILVESDAGISISLKGVNWMLKVMRELADYSALATKAVTNITICAAVAEDDLKKGQVVGLQMKKGVLVATPEPLNGARGTVVTAARQGEDVDVSNISGVIEIGRGAVTILQTPGISKGGSKHSDIPALKKIARQFVPEQIAAIGIEALVALRKANLEPHYFYGVTEAAIEATRCGLPFLIVCSSDAVPGLTGKLQQEKVEYTVTDISL